MSSDQKIGAPFTLASLPRPISASTGRTQASSVCSISGLKKRKRTEIAVGVDGEGVLIYSLQNPRLVTSYALPPETSFETAPYSIYKKGSSIRSVFRFTYAVVTPSTTGEQSQFLCFTEEIQRDGTTDTTKTAYTIRDSANKVISIESIPSSSGSSKTTSHDVLIVFENGKAICLSSDLESKRWESHLVSLLPHAKSFNAQDAPNVDSVTLTTTKAALSGLLRNRGDIAALVDPSSARAMDVMDSTSILCIMSRHSKQKRSLSLMYIQPRAPDLVLTQSLPVKHLLTWDLPRTDQFISPATERFYQLHPSSGVLHELTDSRLLSYDFTGTIPKLYSNFSTSNASTGLFLRLSADLIFTVSQRSWNIFDSKYSSIQAFRPRGQAPEIVRESRKRKHISQGPSKDSDSAPILVSYFNDLRLAVGIVDQALIGVQISESVARKRAKHNSTLLIDSIGNGLLTKSMRPGKLGSGPTSQDRALWQDWQKKIHKLDKYASKGKVAEFESLVADHLAIEFMDTFEQADTDIEPKPQLLNGAGSTSLLTNGVNGADKAANEDAAAFPDRLRKWKISRSVTGSERTQHRHIATFALRKIFRFVSSAHPEGDHGQNYLKIVFFPPNVFEWLLFFGYLTKESICRSLLEDSPDNLGLVSSIQDGDIARAIVDFDSELHILSAVLNQGQYLPVGEVVQAIRILMQSLDGQPRAAKVAGLLTNGDVSSANEIDMDITSEIDAATNDLDQVQSLLDNGLHIRSHTLRPALMRLHTFPIPVITSTLRSMLPRRELESLVRLLHSELRNGGWTAPYDFVDMSTPEGVPEDPDDQAVAIIASLLSCALDVIGAGAWLTSVGDPSSEAAADEMIDDLLQDTSEALNGFWEARYMRGLLSEFLRYASNLSKSRKPTNKSLQNQGKPFFPDVAANETLPMLPLGAKADLGIEKTKAGKGGKREERSAREIGMLISKRVPKYSFERIVI